MTDGEQDVIVCARATGFAVSGSTKTPCTDCGEDVWVAPSSRKMIVSGHVPVCTVCVDARIKADPDAPEFKALNEEQAAEIVRGLAEYRRLPPV